MNFTEDASAVKKLPFTFSLMFQLYRESGWRSLFAGKCVRVFFCCCYGHIRDEKRVRNWSWTLREWFSEAATKGVGDQWPLMGSLPS